MSNYGDIRVFSGSSNPELAKEIADNLSIETGNIISTTFSDGEIYVKINENIRGMDVFFVQSLCTPVNDNLIELLIMIDAARRASARRITSVIPYYGYARQDRKAGPREPITAKLVANLITTAGVDRVLTIDLHTGQIQGFFDIPVDHLYSAPVLLEYLRSLGLMYAVVAAPDTGSVKRARAFAQRLNDTLAIIDKRRPAHGIAEAVNIIGDVKDRDVIMLDDMIDTAGTLVEGAKALKAVGAKTIYACCTHPVLSGPAVQRLSDCEAIKEVIVTNTIPIRKQMPDKIKVVSVGKLLAEAVWRIHKDTSVSSLFV